MGFVRYNKSNIPCQCGYPDEMSPLGRMVFPRAPPSGKPSSLGETFHHDTHTGMAYLYNGRFYNSQCPQNSPLPDDNGNLGLAAVSIYHQVMESSSSINYYVWLTYLYEFISLLDLFF